MKIFLVIILGVIILAISSYFYENKVFITHFVDEEDNIVLGSFLLQDKKLYSDLFSHHQPYAYILSGGVQKITQPNSIFLLIKKNREAIILWSFLWSLLLLIRFGWPFLGFIAIFELTKIYFFGNMFLSETLVVYPLLFLSGELYRKGDTKRWTLVLLGVFISFCALTLSPMWPVLFLIASLILYRNKNRALLVYLLGGFLPLILISSFFIDISAYFYNAFFINLQHYIPLTSDENFIYSLLKGFSAPLISFFVSSNEEPTIYLIRIFSAVFIVTEVLLIKEKKYFYALTAFLVLGLSNIRYVPLGAQFYRGFHLLPWYGLLVFLSFLNISFLMKKNLKLNVLLGVMALIMLGATFYYAKTDFFKKREMYNDYYINYSRQFSIGEAVRILGNDADTLFIAPDEWLVYWQSGVKPASKMINYYAWMDNVPTLRSEIEEMFKNKKPTFVYLNFEGTGIEEYLTDYKAFEKDEKPIKLYVLNEKIKSITDEQIQELEFHNFKLP